MRSKGENEFNEKILGSFGLACFTTFCIIPEKNGWLVPFWEEHVTRLTTTTKKLHGVVLSKNGIELKLRALLKKQSKQRLLCKIAYHPTKKLQIIIAPYKDRFQRKESVALHLYYGARALPHYKLAGSPLSAFARQVAVAHGCDEALLIKPDTDLVLEGAWSNFFVITRQGRILTPAQELGLLPGITRAAVIAHFKAEEKRLTLEELKKPGVQAFISQATRGLTPVHQIGNIPLDTDKSLELAALFRNNVATNHGTTFPDRRS